MVYNTRNCFCGLVVRVSSYRSGRPRFDSQRYHIFWEIVGLEWGPLSVVSTNEELLSSSGPEIQEYGRGDPLRWLQDILYRQKLALTLRQSLGRYSSLAD
jgi:hypothetical protein